MRTSAFDDFDSLFDRMNRRLAAIDSLDGGDPTESSRRSDAGVRVDVADHDEEFVVVADLPGFERDDVSVTVDDDRLTVSATRDVRQDEATDVYVRRERSARSVRRSLRLPAAVDADGAEATYTNGVLTVTLPKLGEAESGHRIDVA